ncbi:MAG TPA: hypothetical protein VE733_28060 [Streptosporangiaceae bacterium]|nr:hypothetical protein [Streptosporangiaceae bacterium]
MTDGLKAGELKTTLDKSLRATVNSDDPAYFAAYSVVAAGQWPVSQPRGQHGR